MGRTATWKATERRVAGILGGRRMGCGVDRADVRSDWLTVECKHRAEIPQWLKAALGQARRYAGAMSLPVAVLHESGTRHDDDIVCLRLCDFQDWFGQLPEGEDHAPDPRQLRLPATAR